MTDVHEIRRKNLIELISMYKSVANLNSALGRKRYDGTFNQIKTNLNRLAPKLQELWERRLREKLK